MQTYYLLESIPSCFPKKDRDLKGSIDTRVSLIAANNNTINNITKMFKLDSNHHITGQ